MAIPPIPRQRLGECGRPRAAARAVLLAAALLGCQAPAPVPPAAEAPAPVAMPSEPPPSCEHRVRAGETLSALAAHYRVALGDLVAENGIAEPDRIQPQQVVRIPVDPCPAPPAPPGARPARRAATTATPAPAPAPAPQSPPACPPASDATATIAHASALLRHARERYDAADFPAAHDLAAAGEHLLQGDCPLPSEASAIRAQAAWLVGVSCVGMEQPDCARPPLRRAVALDPELPAREQASPKILELLDAAAP